MHAYQRFIREQMDSRNPRWEQHDLVKQSGLSASQVSRILRDRDVLAGKPEPATIRALAKAFGGGAFMERRIWLKVAEAMGLPVGSETPVVDVEALTNEELIRELSRRLDQADETPRHLRAARKDDDK